MKKEQQRIAIAEAMGYLNPRIENGRVIRSAFQTPEGEFFGTGGVPDYPNDLNVMADVRDELINTPELRIKWVNTMRDVVGRTCTRRNKAGQPQVSDIDLLFADAGQLAETLVRAIGKWVES